MPPYGRASAWCNSTFGAKKGLSESNEASPGPPAAKYSASAAYMPVRTIVESVGDAFVMPAA
jgi:hypothetical protein